MNEEGDADADAGGGDVDLFGEEEEQRDGC
jgi:hypothetical protein